MRNNLSKGIVAALVATIVCGFLGLALIAIFIIKNKCSCCCTFICLFVVWIALLVCEFIFIGYFYKKETDYDLKSDLMNELLSHENIKSISFDCNEKETVSVECDDCKRTITVNLKKDSTKDQNNNKSGKKSKNDSGPTNSKTEQKQ